MKAFLCPWESEDNESCDLVLTVNGKIAYCSAHHIFDVVGKVSGEHETLLLQVVLEFEAESVLYKDYQQVGGFSNDE